MTFLMAVEGPTIPSVSPGIVFWLFIVVDCGCLPKSVSPFSIVMEFQPSPPAGS